MRDIALTMMALTLFVPGTAQSQPPSSILPVLMGAYAPTEGGCEAAAAAFVYIEKTGIAANKTAGKVLSIKQDDGFFILDVLWVEAGSNESDGDRDTVQIEVIDDRSFYFSNTASKKTLMRWCS